MDALGILCAQLTRDLFAIAKFLLGVVQENKSGCFVGQDVYSSNIEKKTKKVYIGCTSLC